MPFLIGLQASQLHVLKHLPMDEHCVIDLELGTCEPQPGSPTDDARLLPWSDRLQAALQVSQGLCISSDLTCCLKIYLMTAATHQSIKSSASWLFTHSACNPCTLMRGATCVCSKKRVNQSVTLSDSHGLTVAKTADLLSAHT